LEASWPDVGKLSQTVTNHMFVAVATTQKYVTLGWQSTCSLYEKSVLPQT
jgi:hypothetical protein